MATPFSRKSGNRDGAVARLKGLARACLPRSFGAYWLKDAPRDGGKPRLLLTFDDGPDPVRTPKALDLLDQLGAKAIFFVIGERVARNPGILKEIVARGHFLGNHTQTHPNLQTLDAEAARTELAACQEAVVADGAAAPQYFRPPFGAMTAATRKIADELGMRTVMWANEGGEWGFREGLPADVIAQQLAPTLAEDQIVLFHDDSDIALDVLAHPAFIEAASKFDLSFDRPPSL